ncbi:MAG TPA: acyl-CoA reductase [Flavisolibacter sp.]
MGLNIQQRKELLVRLGSYMLSEEEQWSLAKDRAWSANNWFTPEFIDLAAKNIAENFLQEEPLSRLISQYDIPDEQSSPKAVGIVMAGNIPLVGFHDLLCVFLSGHNARVKPSSKDHVLVEHLAEKLVEWNPGTAHQIQLSERLVGCDAYIATGSNNTSRYFEYYFRNVPSIIRKNRTSVAILSGNETKEELERLADDVYQYFGLGCRNVTQLFVPREYDFIPLLGAFRKYHHLADHNKYRNNYEYNLAVHILNNRYYMSNESILLVEDPSPFSAIAQLHYQFYDDAAALESSLRGNDSIQAIVGLGGLPFGGAQCPQITDYADGVDTMKFLGEL